MTNFLTLESKPFDPGATDIPLGSGIFSRAPAGGHHRSARTVYPGSLPRPQSNAMVRSHRLKLCKYLQAETRFLQVSCPGIQVPLYSASGGSTKSDKLHPYLANILSDRRNWQQRKEMKQPISREMLDTMEAKVQLYTASGTYRKFGRLPAL